MWSLFAVVDDVMSEDDAMHPSKRQMGMGRIQREWKHAKAALGGSYDDNRR